MPAAKSGSLLLERCDDFHYGCLRITVSAERLCIASGSVAQSTYDRVTVDLASHKVVSN
jgi:hypothetical protein